jgi:hypothetical protein
MGKTFKDGYKLKDFRPHHKKPVKGKQKFDFSDDIEYNQSKDNDYANIERRNKTDVSGVDS